jgi:Flp pilus assembly protein TadG
MTRRSSNPRTRAISSDRGSELVEMAIVLPIFVLLLMGIMDFGYLFQRYEILLNSAREGARLAVVDDTLTDTDIELRVVNYANNAGLTGGTPVANAGDSTMDVSGVAIATKTVTVTFTSDFLFLPGSVNLQAVSVMRVQAGS